MTWPKDSMERNRCIIEQIGISMDEMKDPDTRKNVFVNEDRKIKMFLAKASDVPTMWNMDAQNWCGGQDTLLEEDAFVRGAGLGFGK